MEPCFFHVDMDAFYASVEQRDNPDLKGKPVIIGALPGHRGVVSACSYEARTFGVRSAMPVSEAFRRCPEGVYLVPRMEHYSAVSQEIMSVFRRYTPCVQQISIDEAFLDMTGTRRLFGPPVRVADAIKNDIRKDFDLTISIGIARNRFLAKMASEFRKPDGVYRVIKGGETAFLDQLELKDIWGIGKKTIERLESFNIASVASLRSTDPGMLKRMVGEAAGQFLYNAARGIDSGLFAEEPKSRSISNEITFEKDTSDREVISQTLLELSHQVMFRMIDSGMSGKTVQIKVRYSDFTTTTAQTTLRKSVTSGTEIFELATELLNSRWKGSNKLRLLGVGLSNVSSERNEIQNELFDDPRDKKKRVEMAVLKLNKRYAAGDHAITKASIVNSRCGRIKKPD